MPCRCWGTDPIREPATVTTKTTLTHRDLHALIGRDGIARVINRFYDAVPRHPTLAPYFQHVTDWDEVKAHLAHFWWIDMGGERYRPDIYNPTDVHRHFKVPPELVDDWLALFTEIVRDELPAEHADGWLKRVGKMADWTRIELAREHDPRDLRRARLDRRHAPRGKPA